MRNIYYIIYIVFVFHTNSFVFFICILIEWVDEVLTSDFAGVIPVSFHGLDVMRNLLVFASRGERIDSPSFLLTKSDFAKQSRLQSGRCRRI